MYLFISARLSCTCPVFVLYQFLPACHVLLNICMAVLWLSVSALLSCTSLYLPDCPVSLDISLTVLYFLIYAFSLIYLSISALLSSTSQYLPDSPVPTSHVPLDTSLTVQYLLVSAGPSWTFSISACLSCTSWYLPACPVPLDICLTVLYLWISARLSCTSGYLHMISESFVTFQSIFCLWLLLPGRVILCNLDVWPSLISGRAPCRKPGHCLYYSDCQTRWVELQRLWSPCEPPSSPTSHPTCSSPAKTTVTSGTGGWTGTSRGMGCSGSMSMTACSGQASHWVRYVLLKGLKLGFKIL